MVVECVRWQVLGELRRGQEWWLSSEVKSHSRGS